MERLKGMVVYLAGPIDCAKDLGKGWRQEISPKLRDMGLLVLDPTNKPIHDFDEIESHTYRKELKDKHEYKLLCDKLRRLRSYDLRQIDKCDICIVYLNKDIPSFGTIEEFVTANKEKKPCLVFCEQGKDNVNDWVFGMIPDHYIFNNAEEIVRFLAKIHNGEIQPPDNRWVFFNWDKIIKGY